MIMAPKPLTMNPNYLAMVRGTRELHRLSVAGKDESPEADAVRDGTDRSWEALPEVERQRIRNLSEDLYSLAEPPPAARPMNPQAQAKLNDAFEARQRGEWDRALDLLRRSSANLDPALVSYLRGSIWLEAGDPETAVLFYEHASKLQPENGNYLALFLHTLDLVDPIAANGRSEDILREPGNSPPVVVARAADTVIKSARKLPEADANQLFRRLISILQDNLIRIKKGDESGVDRSSYAMTVALLGFCHEFLGEMQAALKYYSEGLQADPDNDGLLVARGMLLYGTSLRAEADFELAIRRGSPVIWPYFFLAHHFLVNGRFQECRMLCERALEMPGSDAVKGARQNNLPDSSASVLTE
jgi:tetratricopeptide (TPR) repeat protein